MATFEMLFRMRRLPGDSDFPQPKQAVVVDSLDTHHRPPTPSSHRHEMSTRSFFAICYFYFLSATARRCALPILGAPGARCGTRCSARSPIAAGGCGLLVAGGDWGRGLGLGVRGSQTQTGISWASFSTACGGGLLLQSACCCLWGTSKKCTWSLRAPPPRVLLSGSGRSGSWL
jgi:hypothetical protein